MPDPITSGDLRGWEKLGAWCKPDPANWAVWPLIYHQAKMMLARTTVEIGVGRGHGTYALGLHAKEVGGQHYAIDVASTPIGRARAIAKAFDLPVTILHGDSKALVWSKRIDLLYVDGGHTTEQVLGDLDNYARWVRRGGLMILDDYGRKHHGVTQAADAWATSQAGAWEVMSWPWCWWLLCRRV